MRTVVQAECTGVPDIVTSPAPNASTVVLQFAGHVFRMVSVMAEPAVEFTVPPHIAVEVGSRFPELVTVTSGGPSAPPENTLRPVHVVLPLLTVQGDEVRLPAADPLGPELAAFIGIVPGVASDPVTS